MNKEGAIPVLPKARFGAPKKFAYKRGCRPVLYLSDKEMKDVRTPRSELWRVVRFEVAEKRWISWLHEREWRCKGALRLPGEIQAVLIKSTKDAIKLAKLLAESSKEFKCVPRSLIPLTVVS